MAGLTAEPSVVVKAPRVGESPIHFECKVTQVIQIGDGEPGSCSIVIGEIVHIHVEDNLLIDGDKINIEKLQPIGRLSGSSYAHINDIFDLIRP